MNRAISRLFMVVVVLFVAVIINLTWIMAVRADWYADRPENHRGLAQEQRLRRGDIVAFDGSLIVGSKRRSGFYSRTYPRGSFAPQLIGYSDIRYGRSGLERQYNDELTGRGGEASLGYWTDRILGRRRPGAKLRLTLVPAVQQAAQNGLAGRRGAIVALNPKSGAVLASASAPAFRPAALEEDWSRLNRDRSAPLLNRATQGLYAPGSSLKVATAAAALQAGAVQPSTRFTDSGVYRVSGGKVTNYHGAVYGGHDFSQALTKSINTTFARVGVKLGRQRFSSALKGFGFDERPPLDLPAGEIATSGRYVKGELQAVGANMDQLALAWAACGQEQVLASPLEMALVTAAIGNGGRMMKPYVMDQVISSSGEVVSRSRREVWKTATDATTAATLTSMMENVVRSGTGTAAALADVPVAGKTGTAERGDGSNLAWFIAFAPANDPRVAVAVVVENVQSTGGDTAAPIAAGVLKAALAEAKLP